MDLRLGADSGLDAIQIILKHSPKAKVVVLTGYGSIATAVKATKLGAVGYLMKPTDVDQIERALLEQVDDDTEMPIPSEFQSLYRHEREYIEFVLAECDGNISRRRGASASTARACSESSASTRRGPERAKRRAALLPTESR